MQAARTQKANARYQAAVAEERSKAYENAAAIDRRQGYDAMMQKKLETADIMSAQRAQQGGTGAVVDYGSNIDVLDDTAERGESAARAEYQKGLDAAYSDEVSAWNARAESDKADMRADALDTDIDRASTLIGGLNSLSRRAGKAWQDGDLIL
jgi:hypothetical protein